MAKQTSGKHQTVQSDHQLASTVVAPSVQLPAEAQIPTAEVTTSSATEEANLKTCLAILAGVQDQVKFGDTKAAFVLAINTLMCGFAAGSLMRSLFGIGKPRALQPEGGAADEECSPVVGLRAWCTAAIALVLGWSCGARPKRRAVAERLTSTGC